MIETPYYLLSGFFLVFFLCGGGWGGGLIHRINGQQFRKSVHHDDVIKWKHFLRYWPFLRGIHRSSVNSPHKGQWHGALMLTLICAWINVWVNNREAGDLRRHRTRLYVTVMVMTSPFLMWGIKGGIEIISGYRILAFSLVVLQYLSLTVSTSRPGDAYMRQWYGFRQWPVAFSTLLMLLHCHLKPPKKCQLNLDQDIQTSSSSEMHALC